MPKFFVGVETPQGTVAKPAEKIHLVFNMKVEIDSKTTNGAICSSKELTVSRSGNAPRWQFRHVRVWADSRL